MTKLNDRYRGKLFSIMGDSVSTLEGYNGPRNAVFYEGEKKFSANVFLPEDTWWGQVISDLGGELLVNESFSGSTVICPRTAEVTWCACGDLRTSVLGRMGVHPDVIIVAMGINDWGCGARPVPNRYSAKGDLSIFSVAYETMLEKMKRNYPAAEIMCCTPPVSTFSREPGFAYPYYCHGRHLDVFGDVIRDLAPRHGCRLIDLYRIADPYDTIDGFHPNAEGMKTLSAAFLRALEASEQKNEDGKDRSL